MYSTGTWDNSTKSERGYRRCVYSTGQWVLRVALLVDETSRTLLLSKYFQKKGEHKNWITKEKVRSIEKALRYREVILRRKS
ncbi:UNVERIFIED_CONTAM: hypothetical protein NCL1_21916 [Trichonephila clavipes]